MGDSENDHPASKKRVAGRQISKENPELDDDGPEPEMGTFRRASDEVLATRKIVKVRRTQTSAASCNPFAALRMVPPSSSGADANNPLAQPDKSDDKKEEKDEAEAIHGTNVETDGTERGNSIDEPNGIENNNKKIEEITEISIAKDGDRLENDPPERATNLRAEESVKKEDKCTAEKAVEVTEEDKEETEERSSGGETERDDSREGKAGMEKLENDNKDTDVAKPAASLRSFQQLSSSQNAFTGIVGTGFGTSSFSFGPVLKEGPTFGASSGSLFGFKSNSTSSPPFGVGGSNNGSFACQASATSALNVTKSGVPSMQEVPVETGEENEKAVFAADAILYEYLDGGWKERGKGELKVNVSLSDAEKARLIMRARGNYRLILNASLYPDMALANMEKKGVTFACMNSAGEGKNGLVTFALKFKDSSFVEEFRGVVDAHKGKKAAILKTPENSPKASDD